MKFTKRYHLVIDGCNVEPRKLNDAKLLKRTIEGVTKLCKLSSSQNPL